MQNKKSIGADGEDRASLYLQKNGYELLSRNWRCATGEIDIIAKKDDTVVFIEVKTWAQDYGDTLEIALGEKKQKRIVKTAKRFLLEYRQYSNSYIRFDVLLVDMYGSGTLKHIENAFSEFV